MEAPAPAAVPEKSPIGLEIGAAILLCVDVTLGFLIGSSKQLEGVELATYSLGSLLFLLVILGIARLIGKAKTRRSRAFIAFVFLVIVLISQLSHLSRQSERRQSSSIPAGTASFAARAA
jgi:hypothetical protein